MTNIQHVQRRLESANTVPSPASLPDGMWSAADLLERVHERNRTMTDTLTPLAQTAAPPPRRRRGPLVALAAAAIVMIVGVAAVLLAPGDDAVIGSSSTPLEVVDALYDAYRDGDPQAWYDLFAREVLLCPTECQSSFTLEDGEFFEDSGATIGMRLLVASNGRLENDCELTDTTVVTCVETYYSGFGGANPVQVSTDAYRVVDGEIVGTWQIESRFSSYIESETANVALYRQWVEIARPADYDELFENRVSILLSTERQRELHTQYIPEYVASKS